MAKSKKFSCFSPCMDWYKIIKDSTQYLSFGFLTLFSLSRALFDIGTWTAGSLLQKHNTDSLSSRYYYSVVHFFTPTNWIFIFGRMWSKKNVVIQVFAEAVVVSMQPECAYKHKQDEEELKTNRMLNMCQEFLNWFLSRYSLYILSLK